MKILYVSTLSLTINSFLIPHIKMLVENGHFVDVACHNSEMIHSDLINIGSAVYEIDFSRNPASRNNASAYKQLSEVSRKNQYDIVHVHTPVAAAITRFAFRNSNAKIVYTAHGFHFYKGAPWRNWALYYPVEKYLAKHTDELITINKEDYEFAKRKIRAKHISYIPGVGIDLNMFDNVDNAPLSRTDIGVPEDALLILSVGELNRNKNHSIVIEALSKIGDEKIHYAVCGDGPLKRILQDRSRGLGLEQNVHLLGYRKDVRSIYPLADLFVFPSKREGLPVALLEALLAGLPTIASDIRGVSDLNGLNLTLFLLRNMSQESLAEEIIIWKNNDCKYKTSSNPKTELHRFGIEEVKKQLLDAYK